MSDVERRFHELWLGMAQPYEGLVVSVPVLVDAGVLHRHPPDEQARLVSFVGEEAPCITDHARFFREYLGYPADAFDTQLPEELKLDVVEGNQTIVPTRALKWSRQKSARTEGLPDDSTPQSRAGAPYGMLTWELPAGLPFDKKETQTGKWHAEPMVKLDRLLRATRVPIGLLSNGHELRLVYAPHGESTGHLTFRLSELVSSGGRPLLDAMLMLLHAKRFFNSLEEHTLPSLLEQSRKRQANVTHALAGQVFEALEALLGGFEAAAEREHAKWLDEALARGPEHVYGGLLTTLLRLVFLLYAEDRGLMPVDAEPYANDLSVKALYESLQEDAGSFPDSMNRRFGAWPRLLALFRAVFLGASHGPLRMPARRGQLFDPEAYPFLEGWWAGGAPVAPEDLATLRVPQVDDETVYRVLDRLVVLEGQRLSYQALDVEQIGSVYEALMGYSVKRVGSDAVCLKGGRVWVAADEVLEREPSQRAKWLEDEGALEPKAAKAAADALKKAKDDDTVLAALEAYRTKGTDRVKAGRLVLQPGKERRRTSSHYTPRSLSAPIVKRALEPLLKAMGERPSSERLLNLKVCDPAMGSGAFLVEACRFLADQVVAAWTREGALKELPKDEDIVMRARRLVAQRCLYGVDKNPFAVNLAKLSLWLVTLAKDEPFTFLDHALKAGDSLVGLDLEQLEAFHWAPKKGQLDLSGAVVRRALELALSKRQAILQLALEHEGLGKKRQLDLDPAREKELLLRDADEALEPLRLIADLCVGAFFSADSEKARFAERNRRLDLVGAWLARADEGVLPPMPEELLELRPALPTFHWWLEFPEVFHGKRPDPLDAEQVNKAAWVDAFVGNPPFMSKNGISALSVAYVPWLMQMHADSHGNADYSAHFFRRAFHLLGAHGTLALIATNTIAQGDTRTSGLKFIATNGGRIYDAVRSLQWPGTANVSVSVVHASKGNVADTVDARLDGVRVAQINSRLRSGVERAEPIPLAVNAPLWFSGCKPYGDGFYLTPEERDELIRRDKRNAERIFPLIGGEEINTSPTQAFHRYTINFGQMPLAEAERWPDLMKIVRERVKPERDRARDNADGMHRKKYWWQFAQPRPELLTAIAPLRRCLALSGVTKHLVPAWQPADRIFTHALFVFAFEASARFSVMQSRVHEVWARSESSSMRSDLRYTPEKCFDTFAFPPLDGLDPIGDRVDADRVAYMLDENVGLTTTYNRLKDTTVTDEPVVKLRAVHEELDRQVLAAYGWSDVAVPPYCGASPQVLEAFEDEVLDRLFALNAERAKAEALAGASSRSSRPRAKKSKVG